VKPLLSGLIEYPKGLTPDAAQLTGPAGSTAQSSVFEQFTDDQDLICAVHLMPLRLQDTPKGMTQFERPGHSSIGIGQRHIPLTKIALT